MEEMFKLSRRKGFAKWQVRKRWPSDVAPHAALRRAGKGNAAVVAQVKAGADSYAQDLAPVVADIQAGGVTSLGGIAAELNARHIQTRRGGRWHASGVRNLLARLG